MIGIKAPRLAQVHDGNRSRLRDEGSDCAWIVSGKTGAVRYQADVSAI
jgi:hypothetical protein